MQSDALRELVAKGERLLCAVLYEGKGVPN